MDTTIDVDRWITVAEAEVCDVDGALNTLGACQTAEGVETHGLANIDAAGVAAYLKHLAERLQVVATNLIHLADNADLTGLAERLKIPTAPVSTSSTDTRVPGASSDMEFDRLLAELVEPMPPSTTS